MNIVDFFTASVRRRPGGVAVRTTAGAMTYHELDQRSDQVCAVLRAEGVRPGSRVAAMLTNRPEFVELILGVAKAGASMVPISVMDRRPQVAHILRDSGACLAVCETQLAYAVAESADQLGIPRLILDTDEPSGYAERVSRADTGGTTRCAIAGDAELYVGYTSGSTGKPKGVVKTHQSVVALGLAVGVEWGLRPTFTQLVTMPMCHSGGFWQVLFNLLHGGTIGIKPTMSFDAGEVLTLLDQWQVNWVVLVPTMSDALVAAAGTAQGDFPALTTVVSGSAPMFTATKEGLLELFPHAELNECYGATETGVVCNLRHADQLRKQRCVGTPIPGVEVRVVDSVGNDIRPGEVGEIVARSPYVLREYLGRPDDTATAIRTTGHVGVGDLATIDDEGYIYIRDRKQDMIISGGLNVYPAEVEEILKSQPHVVDAIVVGLPHEKWGEQVTAAVVADGSLNTEDLLEACRKSLAKYKVPKKIRVLDRLPRLVSGKNSRRLVREVLTRRDDTT